MKHLIRFITFFSIIFMMISPVFCEDNAAGIILDAKGKVSIIYNGVKKPARALMPVYYGAELQTEEGASVEFAYYPENSELQLLSGSSIIIGKNGITIKKGKVLKNEDSLINLPKNIDVTSKRIFGSVLRNPTQIGTLVILSPSDSEILADTVFKITWASAVSDELEIMIREQDQTEKFKRFLKVVKNTSSYDYKPDQFNSFKVGYGKNYTLTVREKLKPCCSTYRELNEITFSILPENEAREVKDAQKEFAKTIKTDPENKTVYISLAELYKEKKMYLKGIAMLKELSKIDRDNPYIYYYISQMYKYLGEKNEAEENYKKAEELKAKGGV